VPGADMQPHLALSAIFLLGLRGIEKKLPITVSPISQIKTAEERKSVAKLGTSLEAAATQMMREGSVAREVLGNDFVDHYGGTREHEVMAWNSAVTNWERESLSWVQKQLY
jgi:glutamine synthetase